MAAAASGAAMVGAWLGADVRGRLLGRLRTFAGVRGGR
jgi:hypothetical protein